METVKETKDYTVYKKRSGRFGVKGSDKKWINGDAKIEILVKESLIKAPLKKQEAPAAEETAEAATTEETAETPAE